MRLLLRNYKPTENKRIWSDEFIYLSNEYADLQKKNNL